MSDILIRGMEMPKHTTKAEFGIDADGNPLCMVYYEDRTEPDIYNIVPLPEGHGRLIDADAVDTTYSDPEVIETLQEAPTVIPAEGGGKNG